MSVIIMIKKTHMPKRCKGCPLETTHENQFIGIEFMCAALWQTTEDSTFNRFNSRHPDCPLVEIPTPHGRLIDADALIAAYDAQHEGEPGRARKLMEEAPTIVEAEDSVNEGII